MAEVRLGCLDVGVWIALATPVNNVRGLSLISVTIMVMIMGHFENLFLHSVKLSHQIVVSIVELAYQISSVVNLTHGKADWDWPIFINPY